MNDEFNMHKSKGDQDCSVLMAGIHVQMTAARYRDDINIASLFLTQTTHPPLACVCSTQDAVYQVVLSSLKESYEFAGV